MPRYKLFNAGVESPRRSKDELRSVLSKLCSGKNFSDLQIEDFYFSLASIIGEWGSEHEQLQTQKLKQILQRTAINLDAASTALRGLQTGLQDAYDIAVGIRVRDILAGDSKIGSLDAAQKILDSFQAEAGRISGACKIAAQQLPSKPDKRGPKKKHWYDKLAVLLLAIAQSARIRPTFYNRGHEGRGWLFDAACALETFLPKEMRSTSGSARNPS